MGAEDEDMVRIRVKEDPSCHTKEPELHPSWVLCAAHPLHHTCQHHQAVTLNTMAALYGGSRHYQMDQSWFTRVKISDVYERKPPQDFT